MGQITVNVYSYSLAQCFFIHPGVKSYVLATGWHIHCDCLPPTLQSLWHWNDVLQPCQMLFQILRFLVLTLSMFSTAFHYLLISSKLMLKLVRITLASQAHKPNFTIHLIKNVNPWSIATQYLKYNNIIWSIGLFQYPSSAKGQIKLTLKYFKKSSSSR